MIEAVVSWNVTRLWPGMNQVAPIASRSRTSRIRGTATRGPNSPCETFTGGSPRRMLSEIASLSKVSATVRRGAGAYGADSGIATASASATGSTIGSICSMPGW